MARKATLEDNLKEIELDAKAKDPFGIQDTAQSVKSTPEKMKAANKLLILKEINNNVESFN